MGTIRRLSDYGRGGTDATSFMQYVDGREPQIHELWYLGLDGISCKVHPTARVEVTTGTVGEFVTNYLAENGCRIQIIRQMSINNSVKRLGVPDQGGVSGFPFICNLLDRVEFTGCGSRNYSNQDWGGRFNDAFY